MIYWTGMNIFPIRYYHNQLPEIITKISNKFYAIWYTQHPVVWN